MKRFIALLLVFMLAFTSMPMSTISFAETGYTDLIISEYVEFGNTKAIEIFNGTENTVTLSEYQLKLYSNGKNVVNNTKPLGSETVTELASGEVLVVVGTSDLNELKDRGDYASSVINFNGNDAMVLLHNDVVIDSIGDVDASIDGDADNGNFGENKTFSRKVTVQSGDVVINDNFDVSQWDDLGNHHLDNIGAYAGTVNQPTPLYTDLLISEYIEGSGQNKALEIYNGTTGTVDLSEYTLELYSNTNETPNATVALNSGKITELAPGGLMVIAKSGAAESITNVAAIVHNVTNFNGDDEIVLKHNGVIIDSLGRLGLEGTEYGKDKTLRRDVSVVTGDTDLTDVFTLDGWTSFSKDTLDDIGQYKGSVVNLPTDPTQIDLNIPADFVMADYYNGTNGLTGNALKSALNDIITLNHTPLTYSEAYDALYHTDHSNGPILLKNFDASADNKVKLFYSGELRDGPAKYSADWNREHVWAKSHGDFGTSNGPGTDLHQLRPTDVAVNSKRGHLDFDYSDNDYAYGNKVDGDSWEPRDDVKGDVARVLFYMAVRYEGEDYLDLELSESLDSFGNTTSGYGEHGKLSTLLEWHKNDPVSDWEISRNNVIYTDYQKNRNPFIDHPEFAEKIFGVVTPVSGVKIYNIQGETHVSTMNGQSVENVAGIVTAKLNYKFDRYGSPIVGFYMQDPTGDGNLNTSDAIFVQSTVDVNVGDSVTVSGTVEDYLKTMDFYAYDQENQLTVTSIKATAVTVVSSNNALPAPVVLGQNGRVVPHDLIASSNFSTFDASKYAADFYESLESMRVEIQNPLVVSAYINRTVGVVPDLGATAIADNDLSILKSNILEQNDVNTEVLLINGAINSIDAAKYIHMGSTFNNSLIGIIDYEWTNYQLYMTEALPSFTLPTVERQVFKHDTTDDELTIGSYNVYNHAASAAQTKTDGIASQIVNDMKSPDIIGLCEVQDNNGTSEGNITDASQTYQAFIDAITVAGGPTYEWTDIEPVANADGGAPDGNIRVGFLYNPLRVSLVDGIKGTSTETVTVDNEGHLSVNPGRIAATATAFDGTRKSLAAEFEFNGENIIVVMNHLKSKGGDNGIYGNVQPPVLNSEAKRIEQAQLVNDFVDDVLAKNADANIVVMGDMNDFQFSQPLAALKGDVLTNMIDVLDKSERFSYTFNGNAQVLDHILVSNNLLNSTRADVLNINSFYGKQDKNNKHSDHDPVMVAISGLSGVQPDVYPVVASKKGVVPKNTEITLSSRTNDAVIYYSVDQALNLDDVTQNTKYTAPIVIDAAKTIHTVAVKGDAVSSVKSYSYELAPDMNTISEARALPLGSKVVLDVYATSPKGVKGGTSFFFQDATGGAYVHSQSAIDNVEEGMHLKIEGKTADYKGHFQISVDKVTVLDTPVKQTPKVVKADGVNEAVESQLIQLIDVTISEISSDNYNNQKLKLTSGDLTINAKLDSRLETADFSSLFAVGDTVSVVGLVSEYEGSYSITLKAAADVEKITVITIAEAKTKIGTDEKVTVEGIVTAKPGAFGNQSFTFEDNTAGAYIYTKSLDVVLDVGTKVRVTGLTNEYKGLFQIKDFDITVLGTETIEPAVIKANELNESVESELVKIEHLAIEEITSDSYKNTYIKFKSDEGTFTARLDSRTGSDVDAVKTKVQGEDTFTVVGTIYQNDSVYTLSLRAIDDIVIVENPELILKVGVKNFWDEEVTEVYEGTFLNVFCELVSEETDGAVMFMIQKDGITYRMGMIESPVDDNGSYNLWFDTLEMGEGVYTIKAYYWSDVNHMETLTEVKSSTIEIIEFGFWYNF